MSRFLTKGHGKRSVVDLAKQLVPSLLEAFNGAVAPSKKKGGKGGDTKGPVVELAKQLVPSLLEACNGDIVSAVRVERNSMLFLSKLAQDSWSDSYHRYKSTMLLLAEHDARIPTSYVPPDVRCL